MGIALTITTALALSYKFNKKLLSTFALTMMGTAFCLYAVGSFLPLSYGVIAVLAVGALSLVYVVIEGIKRKKDGKSLYLFDLGIILFFCAFMAICSQGRDLFSPDEHYCWGWMEKGFYYFDSISKTYDYGGTVIHPPLAGLWEYFITKTWICYSDSMLLFGCSMFMVALMLPVFEKEDYSRLEVRDVFLILLMIFIPGAGTAYGYWTILKDALLGGMLFYALFNLYKFIQKNENYYFIASLLATASLMLTKRAGIVITVLTLGLQGLVTYLYRNGKTVRYNVIAAIVCGVLAFSWHKSITYTAGVFVAVFLGMACGFVYEKVRSRFSKEAFVSGVIIASLAGVIAFFAVVSVMGDFTKMTASAFLYDLICVYDFEDGLKSLPYGFYIIGLILIIITIGEKEELKLFKSFLVVNVLCMAGYYLLMMLLTIKTIGPSNRYNPHVIVRYLAPYIIASLLLAVWFFCNYKFKSVNTMIYGLTFILILMFIGGDANTFFSRFFNKHECLDYYAFERAGITPSEEDMIFFVDEVDDWDCRDREFFYYCFPAKTNMYSGVMKGSGVGELPFKDEKEYAETLKGEYNYVYILSIGDEFVDKYGELFEILKKKKEKLL